MHALKAFSRISAASIITLDKFTMDEIVHGLARENGKFINYGCNHP